MSSKAEIYSAILQGVDICIKDAFDRSITPESNSALTNFLGVFLQSIRFGSLSEVGDLEAIWATIRSEPAVSDLVVDVAGSIAMDCKIQDMDLEKDLLPIIAASATGLFVPPNLRANSAVSDHEHSRFITPKEAVACYSANPWLVGLILMRFTETAREQVRALKAVAAGVR